MIYLKFISRLIRFLKSLLTKTQLSNHKFQNKNQVTNANIILNLLKKKKLSPNYIVDVGCGYGEWTKKLLNIQHIIQKNVYLNDSFDEFLHKNKMYHNSNDFISISNIQLWVLYRILSRFSWYGF